MLLFLLSAVVSVLSKPIMVTFGTNQGPIVPRPQVAAQPRTIEVPRNPAPVSEVTDDIPNPTPYKPLVPHQYRTRLLSYKPPPTLILGTPVDRKYTPGSANFDYNLYNSYFQKQQSREYTGPYLFDKQQYEIEKLDKKTVLTPSVQYNKPVYVKELEESGQYIPQIGVIYSAGVRYYIPQPQYYQQEQEENSVYDRNDGKSNYRH